MPTKNGRRTSFEVERRFPATVDAPGAARRFVADALDKAGAADTMDEAKFIVSEFATNAISHAGSPFIVRVRVDARRVDIVVSDHSPMKPTVAPAHDSGGRGLPLVAALSSRWGWEPTEDGKRVWAELDRPSEPPDVVEWNAHTC
jgi:anti-sigma regulatory factor (Ser/Thr protein kinase)